MSRTYGNFTDFIDFSRASSGTYLGSDGLLKTAADNVPRVEYDANGNEIGLLIEEQRTNLVTYSEDFTQWTNSNTTDALNAVGPDGQTSATTITNSASGNSLMSLSSVQPTGTQTLSLFVKAGTSSTVTIVAQNSGLTNNARATLTFSSLTVASAVGGTGYTLLDSGVEDYGNGWYRLWLTYSLAAGVTDTLRLYAGNFASVVSGETVVVYGAQLEEGSFATSLIPTSGAQATRSADIANIATANFGYNPKAGTVVVEFLGRSIVTPDLMRIASLNDGTTSNRIDLLGVSTEQIQTFVVDGGSNVVGTNTSNAMSDGQVSLVGSSYSLNDYATVLNGVSAVTDTSATVPAVDTLSVGTSPTNTFANGHIKSIKYRPRRNTNTQLQEFTS